MADQRKKDVNWAVADEQGNMPTWERIGIAVMMDVRDELKELNRLLHCHNFTDIPHILRGIRRKLPVPKVLLIAMDPSFADFFETRHSPGTHREAA